MENLETQLTQLRLQGMKQCYQTLLETRQHLQVSFSEGLELLLQAEEQSRKERRFERLKHKAQFRYQASIEEVLIDPARGMSKELLFSLSGEKYVKEGRSVLVTGASGCGKSFFATALGYQACNLDYTVAYYSSQKLLNKIKLAQVDGTIFKFMHQLAKTDLLIMDDFGLSHLDKQQRNHLMEIIEDRHGKKATIIASQLPVENWYDLIGESTIADAIMDRLVHASIRVKLQGESLRKKM